MDVSPAQQAARGKIAAQLAAAGFALPGTLTVRAYACGKPNCRCHADPPRLHGPYAEWTRKIGGKTITRRLTPAELADWQPLFDNAKKIRALLAELQDLTLEIIEAGPYQDNVSLTGQEDGASPAQARCGAVVMFSGWLRLRPARYGWLCPIRAQASVVPSGFVWRVSLRGSPGSRS